MRAEGHRAQSDELSLKPWRRVARKPYKLVSATGMVALKVEPSEAAIVLSRAEEAPVTLSAREKERRVPAGTWQVDVSAAEHLPARTALTVPPGGEAPLALKLEHEFGKLTVEAGTEGVTMLVYPAEGNVGPPVVRSCSFADLPASEPLLRVPLPVREMRLDTGAYELFFVKQNHFMRRWGLKIEQAPTKSIRATLNPIAHWSFETQGAILSRPALGDVDGDGALDCVVGSRDKKVYALSGKDGRRLWEFETGGPVDSSPVLGDVDGDGALDCVVGSHDNKVYALRATARPAPPSALEISALARHTNWQAVVRLAGGADPRQAIPLGRALLALGRAAEATAPLRLAAAAFPRNVEARVLLARASGRPEPLVEALRIDPAGTYELAAGDRLEVVADDLPDRSRAVALMMAGRPREAIPLFDALMADGLHPELLSLRGRAMLEAGNPTAARANWDAASRAGIAVPAGWLAEAAELEAEGAGIVEPPAPAPPGPALLTPPAGMEYAGRNDRGFDEYRNLKDSSTWC